jgi:drug/metabolite transporter (DMT)-like permease
MKPIHLGALILLAAIWGASFLFIREAAHDFGPLALMFLRTFLASLVLIIVMATKRNLPDLRSKWRAFLIMGILNAALPFSLIAFAELTLTASLASILNSTTPLWTALVATLWIGEKLTPQKIMGLIMGIVGVTVLVGGSPLDLNSAYLIAVFAMLTAAFCYALGTVYASRHIAGISAVHASIGQLLGAAIVLLIPAAVTVPNTMPSISAIISLLALVLLSSSFAYLLYFFLLQNVGPTNTAATIFLVPVFGTIWGIIFFHEPFNLGMLLGMALILMSVGLVLGIKFRKARFAA